MMHGSEWVDIEIWWTLGWKFRKWQFIIIMTHSRPWRVDHSIMINVTWRHFDQSAKQLIVGHTTNLIDQRRLIFLKRLYNSGNSLFNSLSSICYGSIYSPLPSTPDFQIKLHIWKSFEKMSWTDACTMISFALLFVLFIVSNFLCILVSIFWHFCVFVTVTCHVLPLGVINK